ncbi:hypothetical protein LINPERHAP2_LOCUS15251 [Linum perenne]
MITFKSYRSNFKLNIVIQVEPRVSGIIADRVCRTLGFEEVRCVEAIGFSGGIWVLWHLCNMSLTVLEQSNQFFHFQGN